MTVITTEKTESSSHKKQAKHNVSVTQKKYNAFTSAFFMTTEKCNLPQLKNVRPSVRLT